MKTNQTMFNYSDDFGIGPAIELLVHGNCNAGGGIFTFVGTIPFSPPLLQLFIIYE